MNIDDEKIMAFLDGELAESERAEVEAALADDAALREKLSAHRRLRAQLAGAFDGVLSEPIPQRLLDNAAPRTAEVVDLTPRRAAKWSVREWGAMAASIAIGLLIGVGAMNGREEMIAVTNSGMVAEGALARALDTQLAADSVGFVRIGVSFRNREGGYCRAFDLTEGGASGLACRTGDAWAVNMAVASAAGGEVRQAGAPVEILAAIDAMIEGEPLDAQAERQARDANWE